MICQRYLCGLMFIKSQGELTNGCHRSTQN